MSSVAATQTQAPIQSEEQEQDQESLTAPLLPSERSIVSSSSHVAVVGAKVCPIESLDYEYGALL